MSVVTPSKYLVAVHLAAVYIILSKCVEVSSGRTSEQPQPPNKESGLSVQARFTHDEWPICALPGGLTLCFLQSP